MGRRKSGFLVKLFNLVYIAACGISIYALCTRPIFKANIHVHFTKEKMGTFLSGLFGGEDESESEEEVRLVYRGEVTETKAEIKDYITKQKIESYFPNGYDVDLPLEIGAKQAFNIKNTHLLDDLIQQNLGTLVNNVYNSIIDPLQLLFRDIVEGFAMDTLADEINKQIEANFPGGTPATAEEVQQVFDNVYSLLDGDEPVTVDTLAETILHGKEGENNGVLDIINSRGSKYVEWDPQPSEDQVNADISAAEEEQQYFVVHIEYEHNTKEYNDTTVYCEKEGLDYVPCDPQPTAEEVEADRTAEGSEQKYFLQVVTYPHNTEPWNEYTTYYQKTAYTNDDIDDEKIAEQMTAALEEIDGLVTKVPVLCDPQPTADQMLEDMMKDEKDRIYYVLDENGDPVLPTSYDPNATYYTVDKVVNDIDTAMAALIDSFLNGGSGGGKAIIRAEEAKLDSEKEVKSLSENIKDYLYGLIPTNVSERAGAVGEKAPFVLLAIIFLFALPWLWFAIVTIIRTISNRKVWTRPMIVLFWDFPQMFFGIILTYGSKYIIPFLAERIEALQEYTNSFNFDLRTGCLIPSFVYLGVAAMTIVYWIIRRPLKVQYKLEKRIGYHTRLPKRPREPKPVREPKVKGAPRQPKPVRKPKYLIPRDPDEFY